MKQIKQIFLRGERPTLKGNNETLIQWMLPEKNSFWLVHMKFDNLAKTNSFFPAFLHKEAIFLSSLRFYHFLHLIVSTCYSAKFLVFSNFAQTFY